MEHEQRANKNDNVKHLTAVFESNNLTSDLYKKKGAF